MHSTFTPKRLPANSQVAQKAARMWDPVILLSKLLGRVPDIQEADNEAGKTMRFGDMKGPRTGKRRQRRIIERQTRDAGTASEWEAAWIDGGRYKYSADQQKGL